MARAFLMLVGGLVLLGSCTQRTICPAFQSAYIYDRDELRKKFSYFQEDSTPKVLTASKNRYLVAEPTPYRKKLRSLQTVAMKPVLVQVPDSLVSKDSVSLDDLDRAARSVIDSTFIEDVPGEAQPVASGDDSVYVISKDKELRLLKYNTPDSLIFDPVTERYVAQKQKYYVKDVRLNIEQDNYMWYLRDYLVLPDVRLARVQQDAERTREAREKSAGKKQKKGFKGFFKNLFKKKPKESDSTDVPPPPRDDFDFIDTDTVTQAMRPPAEPETRKGFFSPRKKKAKASSSNDVAVTPEGSGKKRTKPADAKKEEEESAVPEGF